MVKQSAESRESDENDTLAMLAANIHSFRTSRTNGKVNANQWTLLWAIYRTNTTNKKAIVKIKTLSGPGRLHLSKAKQQQAKKMKRQRQNNNNRIINDAENKNALEIPAIIQPYRA